MTVAIVNGKLIGRELLIDLRIWSALVTNPPVEDWIHCYLLVACTTRLDFMRFGYPRFTGFVRVVANFGINKSLILPPFRQTMARHYMIASLYLIFDTEVFGVYRKIVCNFEQLLCQPID